MSLVEGILGGKEETGIEYWEEKKSIEEYK
jgi:hypothetical protein